MKIYNVLFIMFCMIVNCILLVQFSDNYIPENFSMNKLKTQKYRCIRYFYEKEYDKYTEKKCSSFKNELTNFHMAKSFHIGKIVFFNVFVLLHNVII